MDHTLLLRLALGLVALLGTSCRAGAPSPASDFVNGQVLYVDGGLLAAL